MKAALSDLRKILVTWSDQSHELAHEMARAGFVQMLTVDLHAGLSLNSISKVSKASPTNKCLVSGLVISEIIMLKAQLLAD